MRRTDRRKNMVGRVIYAAASGAYRLGIHDAYCAASLMFEYGIPIESCFRAMNIKPSSKENNNGER